tara:strand:+ start:290 stop:493 length:204 start_codon:yes stop_codon:yes gene_type:complete
MADIKTIILPIPGLEYDENEEAVTRRIIEQAVEDLGIKIIKSEKMQETIASKAIKRHQFLLMGAKHG